MQVTTSELQIGRGAGNVPAGANQMCMEQAALKLAGGGAEIRRRDLHMPNGVWVNGGREGQVMLLQVIVAVTQATHTRGFKQVLEFPDVASVGVIDQALFCLVR